MKYNIEPYSPAAWAIVVVLSLVPGGIMYGLASVLLPHTGLAAALVIGVAAGLVLVAIVAVLALPKILP